MVRKLGILFGAAMALTLVSGVAAAQDLAVCTNAGSTYQPGDIACLPACHGAQRLARCDVVEGAAKWTTIADACPNAWFDRERPAEWLVKPVSVAALSPLPARLNYSPFGNAAPAEPVASFGS